MTQKLAPGSPPLVLGDDTTEAGEIISDSSWEGQDEPGDEEKAKTNLGKIARARKAKSDNSAKG
jgi:hypothetical protein